MPYIEREGRELLTPKSEAPGDTPGQLNFQITSLVLAYLREYGHSYQTMNDIVGALESAKLEFYRRVVVPYEEEKIHTNGDVY